MLILALLPIYFVPAGVRSILERHGSIEIIYLASGIATLGIAYFYARSATPRVGAWITLIYFSLLPFIALVVYPTRYQGDEATGSLMWGLPVLVMALILLPPNQMRWVLLFNVALYFTVPAFWSRLTYEQVFPILWLVIGVGGLLNILAYVQNSYIQQTKEKTAQNELSFIRYREIFLGSPVALFEVDFSAIKKRLDGLFAEHGERLIEYISANPDAMQGAASSISILDMNQMALDLYETSDAETLKQSLHKTSGVIDLFSMRDGVLDLWQGKKNNPIEVQQKTLQGNSKNVVVRFAVGIGYENTWERVIISIVDITKSKEAEASARLLASAVEASASSVIMTDLDGNIEYVNPAFEKVSGYSAAEVMGSNPRFLKSGQHSTEFYTEMWKTLRTGVPWHGELANKKKNGQIYWEMATISPVQDETGVVRHYVAVKDDISARKNAERQAAQLLQEQIAVRKALEAINASLDIDTVLHQIATEIGEAVDATSAYIWRWDVESLTSINVAEYLGADVGEKERVSSLGERYTESDAVFIQDLQENRHSILHVSEADSTNIYETHLRDHEIKSALYIPIQLQDQIVAFVEIWDSRAKRDFHPDEIILCQHIAQNAAIAINNARNYEQAQHEIQRRKETERELRKLSNATEQSGSGIVITDIDSVIEFANPAASRITGYETAELIGKMSNILKSGKHDQSFYDNLWKTITRGDTWRGELINRRKDGTYYWESQVISSVRDSAGNITHYVAVKEDITQRKEAAEQLRNLSNATEQTASGIVITDAEGLVEYINPAFTNITGYSLADLRGKSLEIQRSGEHPKVFYDKFDESMEAGQVWKGEIINRRKDGSLYWESLVVSPIKDDRGVITNRVYVKEDISLRKELEQALSLAHEEALVASDMKTQLLANVSHDMRTPLGAILGYTEMLQAGIFEPLNKEQDDAMRAISASAQRLLDFVNNLLSQAQIDTGKLILNTSPFKPQKLITALGGEFSFARSKGLEVETEVDENLPETVTGDAYWLGQILHNLVSNAIKFTPETGKIKINFFRYDASHWAMRVADTGKGIPPEAQGYIFESFRQVDGSIQRETHTGSGLGLSIVKHLVRLMDGEINLESELGQGSTFTVILPLDEIKEN